MMSGSFPQRYLVARYSSGGVVVDLHTGNYFRVDTAAAEVCDVLMNDDSKGVADEVARRLKLPRAQAAMAVTDTLSALATARVHGPLNGPYHFHPEESGFGLWHAGKRVLAVESNDLNIYIPEGAGSERSPLLEFYVRALAPKLMFLIGLTVLHASACKIGNSLVAFAGPSGAGKTTTARAFVRAGAGAVVEDLLVLKPGMSKPSAVLDGEVRVHAWAKKLSLVLAAGSARVPSSELATMADGPHVAVNAVLFVDVARRAGTDFCARSLSGPDALVALMANDFLGAASPAEWRRYFTTAIALAASTELAEVTAPFGVDTLDAAAARYTSKWTSYRSIGSGVLPSHA
jgi:hypothetical protein